MDYLNKKTPGDLQCFANPVNSPAALPGVRGGSLGLPPPPKGAVLPRLGLSLRWDGAGFRGAVPVYGVDRLVPQGIEDPWKAAGQVAGNADLVFCSSADPPPQPDVSSADLCLYPTATVSITRASL